MPVAHTTLQM